MIELGISSHQFNKENRKKRFLSSEIELLLLGMQRQTSDERVFPAFSGRIICA